MKISNETVPVPLAEHVDPTNISHELEKYGSRRTSTGLFRSAWNQIEFALNQNVDLDEGVRESYFDLAQLLLNKIIKKQDSHENTKLGSLVLSTYLPLLAKRSRNERMNAQDCIEVYQSLGAAMHFMKPLRAEEPPQWQMMEVAVLALSARTEQPSFLLYPSSPREECSNVREFNHDSYFMADLHSKLPIQQKLHSTMKEYDDWVTILCLQPMVKKGLKKCGLEDLSLSETINYLLSLIVAETQGEELSKGEKTFLDHLSSGVVAHRLQAENKVAA